MSGPGLRFGDPVLNKYNKFRFVLPCMKKGNCPKPEDDKYLDWKHLKQVYSHLKLLLIVILRIMIFHYRIHRVQTIKWVEILRTWSQSWSRPWRFARMDLLVTTMTSNPVLIRFYEMLPFFISFMSKAVCMNEPCFAGQAQDLLPVRGDFAGLRWKCGTSAEYVWWHEVLRQQLLAKGLRWRCTQGICLIPE